MRMSIALLAIAAGCGQPQPLDTSQLDVIYGDDDRRDVYEAADNPVATQVRSTVALVKKTDLAAAAGGYKLPTETFGESYDLCTDEPYRDQPNPAFCSGFLVAPDLIATAGHCITSATDCASTAFVFDFAMTSRSHDPTAVAASQVYTCKEVLESQAPSTGADFALIRIDRAVTDRAPVAVRREGAIDVGAPLIVVGHPVGLPTKVAGGASVRTNTTDGYFVANLDTYGGNSGSAVFNATTGVVEGILVRGENDFTSRGSCRVSYRCAAGDCRGEDVTLATAFASLIGTTTPPDTAPTTITKTHTFAPLAVTIPDNNATGIAQKLQIAQIGNITKLQVQISIKHTYIGDLQVYLYHPDGTTYATLHNRTGGSADNILQTYSTDGLAAAELAKLTGKAAAGTWQLLIRDRAAADIGKLEKVEVTLTSKL